MIANKICCKKNYAIDFFHVKRATKLFGINYYIKSNKIECLQYSHRIVDISMHSVPSPHFYKKRLYRKQ